MNKQKLANWVVSIGSTALVVSIASIFGNQVPAQVANPNKEPNDTNKQEPIGPSLVASNSNLNNGSNVSVPTNSDVPAKPEANQTSPTKSMAAPQTQAPVHKPVSSAPVAPPKSVPSTPSRAFTPTPSPAHVSEPKQVHKHTTTRAS